MNCHHGNQLLPTDSRDILLQSLWEVLKSFILFYFPYISTALWSIVRSGTDLISLLILLSMFLFLSFFLRQPLQKSSCDISSRKSLRLHHFKSDQDEIWQECSLCKYASADRVGFLICRHNFKMAAMKSLHAGVCCAATWWVKTKHLLHEYAAAPVSSWSIVPYIRACYFSYIATDLWVIKYFY